MICNNNNQSIDRKLLYYTYLISVLQTESNYDFLYIYDGPNQSTLLKKLDGNKGSFEISSTGNSLLVVFQSDGSVIRTGFHATIQYVSGSHEGIVLKLRLFYFH